MSLDVQNDEERVLIVAPTWRDGDVTSLMLRQAGMTPFICTDLKTVALELRGGVGAIVLTDRALFDPDLNVLLGELDAQPSWSDIPVILLTHDHPATSRATQVLQKFRNVTLLDRPTSIRTMISSVRTALRARQRQYEVRAHLEALRAAEQALRLADQRKDEFLATLAHELRNPLAPLRTGLQLLSNSSFDSAHRARIQRMMERQVVQLVKLIDDLLEVSRIATGKVVLKIERVDLRMVIESAVESTQPLIQTAQHRLVANLPADPVWVDADPSRIEQVICNVLNNACKYTPRGGRIEVSLTTGADRAELRVIDDGLGIPAEMLPLVFDMFTQIDRSLDRAQGGLGIGLSLVKRLMHMHRGEVSAMSEGPDKGSTFLLTLPLATQEAATVTPALDLVSATAEQRRILVVDDNRDAAESLAMLLEMNGHKTRIAFDGGSALDIAPGFQPHIAFCDLGMPGMNGFELAASLRASYPDIVLVALTGWGSEEDKRRTRAGGFDFHVTKPIAFEEIERILGAEEH